MSKDVFKLNEEFLRAKGIELKPTGLYGMPYEGSANGITVGLDEWSVLHISALGRHVRSVSMVDQILTEEDLLP